MSYQDDQQKWVKAASIKPGTLVTLLDDCAEWRAVWAVIDPTYASLAEYVGQTLTITAIEPDWICVRLSDMHPAEVIRHISLERLVPFWVLSPL